MDPNLKKGESPHASFQCFTEYYFWRYFFLFLVCNFLYAVGNIILYRIFIWNITSTRTSLCF